MFEPNLVGTIRSRQGRDVHGTPIFGPERVCPFAIVNLVVNTQKTSVRADSSGSRGAADEIASNRLKILIAKFIQVEIEDRFIFDGMQYSIRAKHVRRTTFGEIDHFECDLEVMP
jgi:hypothetical protein